MSTDAMPRTKAGRVLLEVLAVHDALSGESVPVDWKHAILAIEDEARQYDAISDKLDEERQTLSVEQAARVLGIGRGTAYQAIRSGDIPSIRIGRRLVVPQAALDAYLATGVGFLKGRAR